MEKIAAIIIAGAMTLAAMLQGNTAGGTNVVPGQEGLTDPARIVNEETMPAAETMSTVETMSTAETAAAGATDMATATETEASQTDDTEAAPVETEVAPTGTEAEPAQTEGSSEYEGEIDLEENELPIMR